MTARRLAPDPSLLAFLALWAGVLALRITALTQSELNLHFDEAQYWAWSRNLEWGYFSKPPLVAWAIAATTVLFGDAEWAIRLSAPIAQALACLCLYGLGRSMYGAWVGFWAGTAWMMLPAVWLSSGIISTDALLLALWSLALFALWRLIVTRGLVWAIVLGLAVGAGALTKYAMLYFVICAVLAAWWVKPARAVLASRQGVIAGLVALAMLIPNLAWNVRNSFATISHTASNARLTSDFINPGELGEFILSQAGVIGPLMFLALIGLFWRAGRRAASLSDEDRFLLAFILPPLLAIMVEAFISRANANWAAAAYPAATVWIAGNLMMSKAGARFLAGAVIVNALLGGVLAGAAVNPEFANRIGLANSLKRSRAWDRTAASIAEAARERPGYTAVLVDHRALYYELAYYWRNERREGEPLPPVRMWLLHADARNSAEASDPMRREEGARVLVVHMNPDYLPVVAHDFSAFQRLDPIEIQLGGGILRKLDLSVGEGFQPAPRDEAFERRLRIGDVLD